MLILKNNSQFNFNWTKKIRLVRLSR